MPELRCDSKLHAILDEEFVEIKCGSRFCGAQPGVVILHRFDLRTGDLIKTLKFREPVRRNGHNATPHINSVRHP